LNSSSQALLVADRGSAAVVALDSILDLDEIPPAEPSSAVTLLRMPAPVMPPRVPTAPQSSAPRHLVPQSVPALRRPLSRDLFATVRWRGSARLAAAASASASVGAALLAIAALFGPADVGAATPRTPAAAFASERVASGDTAVAPTHVVAGESPPPKETSAGATPSASMRPADRGPSFASRVASPARAARPGGARTTLPDGSLALASSARGGASAKAPSPRASSRTSTASAAQDLLDAQLRAAAR
jgi:hypothetical protein